MIVKFTNALDHNKINQLEIFSLDKCPWNVLKISNVDEYLKCWFVSDLTDDLSAMGDDEEVETHRWAQFNWLINSTKLFNNSTWQ